MQCYNHPQIEATATCVTCGKALCSSCAVDVGGRIHCEQCLAAGAAARAGAVPNTNTLAIVSLISGILGLVGCLCGANIIFGLVAAVTGYLGRKQIMESGGTEKGQELATIGLVLGVAGLVLFILNLILGFGMFGLSLLTTLSRFGY